MTFIAQSADGGLVAAARKNAEVEAIPRQSKIRDKETIPELLNPSPIVPPRVPVAPAQLLFESPMARSSERKKSERQKIKGNAALQ